MHTRKTLDVKNAKAPRDRDPEAEAKAADRAPSKTYFRYPAAARRRVPVRFH